MVAVEAPTPQELNKILDTTVTEVVKKKDGFLIMNWFHETRYMTILEGLIYRLTGNPPLFKKMKK